MLSNSKPLATSEQKLGGIQRNPRQENFMNEMRSVGIPSPRVEGEQKVGGIAKYAVDISLPDMLWAKVLRSPLAHARINSIDVAKARALPGVVAVMTSGDLAGAKIGKKIIDMPLLAEGVTRFMG